jgi:hypothetical protein
MSSGPEPDRMLEVADDLHVIREHPTDDVGGLGRAVCLLGIGLATVLCGGSALLALALLGIGPSGAVLVSVIGDVLCLGCLVWVVRGARARAGQRRVAGEWSRTRLAGLIGLAVRLFLPADIRWIKWEEWCGELARIDSRWERTTHLLGLLGRMHRVARAARERKRRP